MSSAKAGKVKKALDDDIKADIKAIKEGSRKELSPVAARYLRNIANPAGSALGGIPTLIGGYSSRSDVRRFRAKGTFQPGTLGFGFLAISPMPSTLQAGAGMGPTFPICSDGFIGTKSTSAWTGGAMPNPGATMPAGCANVSWTDSDLTISGTGTHSTNAPGGPNLGFRLVGCSIEVFPEASFADSNGEITLWEVPGHICPQGASVAAGNGFSYDDIAGNAQARTIRATQTGSQKDKIILNFHPRSAVLRADDGTNDFAYHFPNGNLGNYPTSGQVQPWTMVIAVSSTAGSMNFHYTITGIYEIVGRRINGKVRPVDSRGMDLVYNVLASKNLSGYVGQPEHVEESYIHQAWKHATKSLGSFVSSKSRELLESAASHGLEALGGFL